LLLSIDLINCSYYPLRDMISENLPLEILLSNAYLVYSYLGSNSIPNPGIK